MDTLSFQAPKAMKKQLEMYAKKLDRSKAHLIRAALAEYMEDLKDYVEAKAYQTSHDEKGNLTLDEVRRKLNLK